MPLVVEFSMFGEICALIKALDIAIEDGYNKRVFFTDSPATCKILASNTLKNYLVALFHNKLEKSTIERCHLVWKPSHRGIQPGSFNNA